MSHEEHQYQDDDDAGEEDDDAEGDGYARVASQPQRLPEVGQTRP